MSRLSKLLRKVAPVASLAAPFLPGVGGLIAKGIGIAGSFGQVPAAPAPLFQEAVMPSIGPVALPPIGGAVTRMVGGAGAMLGFGAGGLVRAGVGGAKAITRSAIGYCRRHPQWCSTIGGIAAVEGLISQGQLPPIKRRRGRGISATELRHFKRVVRFTSKYCAPVHRAMRAPAMRRHKTC